MFSYINHRRYIAKLRVAETERALLNSSATKIQAQYRGFATRRKLQQHSQSIAKFQLKFREWITEKKHQEKVAKEKELDNELQTKKVILWNDLFFVVALDYSNNI